MGVPALMQLEGSNRAGDTETPSGHGATSPAMERTVREKRIRNAAETHLAGCLLLTTQDGSS